MRIDTIAIDGFGQFHGAQLSPAPGLTVIRGPNEAGKTTLLAFTRAMLFGFATHRYPALNGGKRGGWLDVVMDDGRALRIERFGDRGGAGRLRVIENHEDLGPGQLAIVLQGVETSVYQNIFAFGLGELTRFETLKDDEVAARIYGAGLGTGGVSGLKVEQRLQDRMEEWFKSGGSKPKINDLLRQLEDVDRELDGRDLPADYAAAGVRLQAVTEDLAQVGARWNEIDAEHRQQQRLKDGWETWLLLRRAEGERDELGEVLAFDADVLERLSALETSLGDNDRAVEAATRERDRARASLEGAVVDEATLARRDELEGLVAATKIEAARADERARTERELTTARAEVERALANLGAGWTDERVEAFDDSIAIKSDVSGRFRTSLSSAERALVAARDAHAAAEEQLEEANVNARAAAERVAELEELLAGRPAAANRERGLRDLEDLADRLAQQRQVAEDAPADDLEVTRASLDERRAQARELAEALRSRQSAREMLPGFEALDRDTEQRSQQQYLPPAVLGIGGVVIAIVLALLEMSLVASVVVAAAGIGGAAAWIVVLRRQGSTGHAADREHVERQLHEATSAIERLGPALDLGTSPTPADVERCTDLLDEERRALEREEDRLERAEAAGREVDRLSHELQVAAVEIGLPEEPSEADLRAFGEAISADRETEAARAAAVEREAQLKAAAQTQAKRVADLGTAVDKRTEEEAAARAEWQDWLEGHELARTYDRETAGRLLDSITSAKGDVAALRKVEARSAELGEEYDAYAEQVRSLAPLLGADAGGDEDVVAVAALLAKLLADALKGEQARDELARTLQDKDSVLTTAEEGRDAARSDIEAFLAAEGVEDTAGLRLQVERSRRAAELDGEVAAARDTLAALSGPGKALERLLAGLEDVEDIATVEEALSELTGRLDDLRDERDALNQEAGALRKQREEMESDAAATELRQERADLLSQLEAGARQWSVLALARQILDRSRSVYEEAHRPAVIEKAEYFFKAWTEERYRRIIAPLGEDVRGVERRDGVEVSLSGLSRGTSEQLYLALRFGLVQHFVETSGEPLPIVMDDILVNFDPERAERAARSIKEIAETCQVIYFTCHETTPLDADLEQQLPRLEVSA